MLTNKHRVVIEKLTDGKIKEWKFSSYGCLSWYGMSGSRLGDKWTKCFPAGQRKLIIDAFCDIQKNHRGYFPADAVMLIGDGRAGLRESEGGSSSRGVAQSMKSDGKFMPHIESGRMGIGYYEWDELAAARRTDGRGKEGGPKLVFTTDYTDLHR